MTVFITQPHHDVLLRHLNMASYYAISIQRLIITSQYGVLLRRLITPSYYDVSPLIRSCYVVFQWYSAFVYFVTNGMPGYESTIFL